MLVLLSIVIGSALFSVVLASTITLVNAVAMRWLGWWYDWVGIIHTKSYVELGLLELRHFPRLVDEFLGYVLELGQPTSHVIAVLVIIFALLYNIEAIQATTRYTRSRAPVLARSRDH